MFDLSILNYRFPSLGGLYNKEESSFHSIKALYQISQYPNMCYCIATTTFSALKQKKILQVCNLNYLKFYCVTCKFSPSACIVIVSDGFLKPKYVAK